MITQISIINFKSIKKIEKMQLKPLTLLTGVNSSGKSNIMEAVSFFAQAARLRKTRSHDFNINLKTTFTYGDTRRYPANLQDFIVHKKDSSKLVTITVNLQPKEPLVGQLLDLMGAKHTSVFQGRVYRRKIRSIGYSYSFRLSDSFYRQRIFLNRLPFISIEGQEHHRKIVSPKKFSGETVDQSPQFIFDWMVFQARKSNKELDLYLDISRLILRTILDQMEKTYFMSGERGILEPERPPPIQQESISSWVGARGENLFEILSRCFTREPEKAASIRKWADRFQLNNIRGGFAERALEINFRDRQLQTDLNSILAGLGSRQILSLITQIFWSEPESVIMVEEPEISLHPENQVLLHELFSEAITQGKQIICSTHSPFFILALSKIVKKKLLKTDQIAIYEVHKDETGTKIKQLELNKHGFIVSGVPSFMKVEEDLFRDWSKSLEEE
jgi:predicted ATPase